MKSFKNIFEVRKSLRFGLKPYIINRNVKPIVNNESTNLLKDFYKSYEKFLNLLWQSFYKKEKLILKNENSDSLTNKPFVNLFKNLNISVEIDKKIEEDEIKYNYEWYKTIQFQYKWLEELFINDWIENIKNIKYDKNGKKKQKNYITFWDLWNKNFVKNFFEEFIKNSEENLKELKWYIDMWLENKSRKSDILFLIQKINSREHLWKLYILFEKNYIQHKNDSSIIDKLKKSILELKEIIQKLFIELKSSQSFWLPVEHISLNYYSVNKTPKEITEEIEKKLKKKYLNKEYIWTFENENNKKSLEKSFNLNPKQTKALELIKDEIKDEINLKELKEKVKLFKAKQKAWFLQLLQNKVSFENFQNPFYFEFMWEKFEDFKITLFSDISKEDYQKMLDLTKKIEQEDNKEKRTKLKMQRWKYFQYNLKKFKFFSEAYKKIAQKYGIDIAEVKSLERQKIDATKLRWWWFLSKENNDYFINTFGIEYSKQVFKEIKNLKHNWDNIKIYILSSITLRALDKLCFKKNSSFIKKIDTKDFNEKITVNEWKNNEKSFWRLKSKKTLLEEWKLLDFYIYILKNQQSLNIKYRSNKSLEILKSSSNLEDFEINLKLETYELTEKDISKQTFENILKSYNWNSYKITSYDLEKWLETKKYTHWWFSFWQKENKSNKYIIRINPELTVFFKEKDKEFISKNPKLKNNRRFHNRFILSTNFSFHSNKSYIDSAFINEECRKDSIKTFNNIFNNKNKLEYFYWLDKWINELITLWIFKKNWEKIESINISEKIPIYRITNKWLSHFEYIKDNDWNFVLDKETWEKKKRFLSKNVSYFIKDLENKELFDKLEIHSCLWDLTYAKLIKWNIILNADIFTTFNLYKITAKRFLNDAITKWNIEWNKILYDEQDKTFYYNYKNRLELCKKVIMSWKDEFDFLPFQEDYKSLKEEIENELNQYIKEVKLFLENSKKYSQFNNEDISIQKINNYKNAISANIVWIIIKLQEYFNWYICFETLDEWQILKKWLSTFIWNVVNEKIYNRLELNLEVPPILKKFRTDIWIKWITQHWKVIYVNENDTSSACPVCNENLLKKDKDWKILEIKHNKLWWHLSDFEKEMKHLTDSEYKEWLKNKSFKKKNMNKWEIKPNKYQAWNINWKFCTFQIWSDNFPEFNFIKSWDDLATYNIAKKWLEYINNI